MHVCPYDLPKVCDLLIVNFMAKTLGIHLLNNYKNLNVYRQSKEIHLD